jgi:MGT family glycosyltransferase
VSDRPTVVFFPEGAYGPTNNCVGVGQVLRARGARVVFVIEESFAGNLAAQGFEERLMRLGPRPEGEEAPGQFWKDFIRDTAPVFRTPTIDQLAGFIAPTWQALVDGSRYVDDRLREILDEVDPNVVVEDNVVGFPAIARSGLPWARIMSCNPAEMKDPAVAPTFSGYPEADRSAWPAFRAEYERTHRAMWSDFARWFRERGGGDLPDLEFIAESPYLNLSLFPAEVDYARDAPLAPTWHRLDSCVRRTDAVADLPAAIREGSGRLLYLSLGSLGSADVELMQRLIDVLGATDHRVVLSMGPQHQLLRLAPNMWGAEFLPQPAILPLVDLVITHGVNNTVTECLHLGKPMILLPLFWDQHDNAQRIDETGFGVRLPTYTFAEADLRAAIDVLTADTALAGRLRAVSARLQADPGTERAAGLIERLAAERAPIVRD